MASELKHDFPIIIKQCSVAFSSSVAKNIKAFVKLTINISPYYAVGKECMNIEAKRGDSVTVGNVVRSVSRLQPPTECPTVRAAIYRIN